MRKLTVITLVLLAGTVGFVGSLLVTTRSPQAFAQTGQEWIVRIDDREITLDEFRREFAVHVYMLPLSDGKRERYAADPANKKKFLTTLIHDYLIYQRAVSEGYHRKQEVQDLIKVVTRRSVNEMYLNDLIEPKMKEVSEEEIEAVYDNNRKVFANVDIDVARQQIRMQLLQKQYLDELNEIIDTLKGEAKVIRNDDILP
jgi:hypothetical protein